MSVICFVYGEADWKIWKIYDTCQIKNTMGNGRYEVLSIIERVVR